MQNSAWRNRNVVYPKQQISRLEEERLLVMGPWQSYAPPIFLSLTIDPFPDFAAGAGKSILWYVSSLLSVRGN